MGGLPVGWFLGFVFGFGGFCELFASEACGFGRWRVFGRFPMGLRFLGEGCQVEDIEEGFEELGAGEGGTGFQLGDGRLGDMAGGGKLALRPAEPAPGGADHATDHRSDPLDNRIGTQIVLIAVSVVNPFLMDSRYLHG